MEMFIYFYSDLKYYFKDFLEIPNNIEIGMLNYEILNLMISNYKNLKNLLIKLIKKFNNSQKNKQKYLFKEISKNNIKKDNEITIRLYDNILNDSFSYKTNTKDSNKIIIRYFHNKDYLKYDISYIERLIEKNNRTLFKILRKNIYKISDKYNSITKINKISLKNLFLDKKVNIFIKT